MTAQPKKNIVYKSENKEINKAANIKAWTIYPTYMVGLSNQVEIDYDTELLQCLKRGKTIISRDQVQTRAK